MSKDRVQYKKNKLKKIILFKVSGVKMKQLFHREA